MVRAEISNEQGAMPRVALVGLVRIREARGRRRGGQRRRELQLNSVGKLQRCPAWSWPQIWIILLNPISEGATTGTTINTCAHIASQWIAKVGISRKSIGHNLTFALVVNNNSLSRTVLVDSRRKRCFTLPTHSCLMLSKRTTHIDW